MVEITKVEIGKRAVTARLEDIIEPGKKIAKEEVIMALKRFEVPTVPAVVPGIVPALPAVEKGLIINIESSGFAPWEDKIIAIGVQDPTKTGEMPTVIMSEDESAMLNELFTIIKRGNYTQMICYGGSFDFRFIVLRAMYYNIPCKEFVDMEIYDLGQAMAQVKFKFMYFAQRQPKLSDIADLFWDYPKPFTDLEMLKYWKSGVLDKVIEFTSSQITRILLLYHLFRQITESPYTFTAPGIAGFSSESNTTPTSIAQSNLTIPEAHAPEMVKLHCNRCLADFEVTREHLTEMCPICGARLVRS